MNSISAGEIKRRGISAVDAALRDGPVRIIKNNRPRYVVMTEEGHAALTRTAVPTGADTLRSLLGDPAWRQGAGRDRAQLDRSIAEQRDSWD